MNTKIQSEPEDHARLLIRVAEFRFATYPVQIKCRPALNFSTLACGAKCNIWTDTAFAGFPPKKTPAQKFRSARRPVRHLPFRNF